MQLNESLQPTAGLRFSQFVAQWPAAAEFRCWVVGVSRHYADNQFVNE
jgi:hypothetical protein